MWITHPAVTIYRLLEGDRGDGRERLEGREPPAKLVIRTALCGLAVGFAGCGTQREVQPLGRIQALAEELVPRIEQAVGLSFKSRPAVAVRSQDQVRGYLIHKLDDELPPEELERMIIAYRLFGLIPDTLDLRELLLALYLEQVVGYYDPDSAMLYVVDVADPSIVKFTLAHELVHALQGQHVPLDSLLSLKRQNDRRTAAQAVFEGQATLASLQVVFPDIDFATTGQSWGEYWRAIREQQERMPVFASAPLVIRETLVFPYLAGADFVWWFGRQFSDTVPFGSRLPRSTEQILHPERYREGDQPIDVSFATALDALYDDGLGEFETRVLLTVLTGSEEVATAAAQGWGGDRYAVFAAGDDGPALIWVSVWDDAAAADRVAALLQTYWLSPQPELRRVETRLVNVEGHPGVRVVSAPVAWGGWRELPRVVVDGKRD